MTDAEYRKVHEWVKSQLGPATLCEIDEEHTAKRFHWANISREYLWDLSDWMQLCPGCHVVFDGNKLTVQQLRQREVGRKELLARLDNGEIAFTLPLPPTPSLPLPPTKKEMLEVWKKIYPTAAPAKSRPSLSKKYRSTMAIVRSSYAELL